MTRPRTPLSIAFALIATIATAALVAGCGSGAADESKPPDMTHEGMTMASMTKSKVALDPNKFDFEAKPVAAETKPVAPGPKTFNLVATERLIKVGDKVYNMWTFNNTVPGPTMRVVQGDRITINLKNASDSKLPHSIDFHAARISPTRAFASIAPGESINFEFTAEYPGVFMYHCGTPPVLQHIGMGMYGMLIVQPKDGGFGTRMPEYAFVQSELYDSYDDMVAGFPAAMAFNGIPMQYSDKEIQVPGTKPNIRVFVLNAGPSRLSSFHVVGTVFDKVFADGDLRNVTYSRQALAIPASGGGVFEMQLVENGSYPFVTHQFNDAGAGAVGMFNVGPKPKVKGEHY